MWKEKNAYVYLTASAGGDARLRWVCLYNPRFCCSVVERKEVTVHFLRGLKKTIPHIT